MASGRTSGLSGVDGVAIGAERYARCGGWHGEDVWILVKLVDSIALVDVVRI